MNFGEPSDCFVKYHVTHLMAFLSLRLSEAVNPLIYLFAAEDLKDETKRFFGMKISRTIHVHTIYMNDIKLKTTKDLSF